MTPNDLKKAGGALYGRQWQTELADKIVVSGRTMRRWASGTHPIPAYLKHVLIDICMERSESLYRIAEELRGKSGTPPQP